MKTQVNQNTHMTKRSQMIFGSAIVLLIVVASVRVINNRMSKMTYFEVPHVSTTVEPSVVFDAPKTVTYIDAKNIPAVDPLCKVESWMSDITSWSFSNKSEESVKIETWMGNIQTWGLNEEFVDEAPVVVESWMNDISSWSSFSNDISELSALNETESLSIESWMSDIDSWGVKNNFIADEAFEAPLAVEEWMVDLQSWSKSAASDFVMDSIAYRNQFEM